MKMKFITVGGVMVLASFCAHGDEMIDYLRSAVRDDGPVFTGKCEDVRELKYPGQRFIHDLAMTIEGSGYVVTKLWGLFKTKNTLYLRHVSHLEMVESIESTPKELEQGIIKSRYKVTQIIEQLEGASIKIAVDSFDSAAMGRWVKTVCEKIESDEIEENKAWWALPRLKFFNRFVLWVDGKIASDGTFVANEEFVKKNLPGYSTVVGKFRKARGTELVSRWEFGKGYTSVNFVKTELDRKDQETIAKLIYRTNPLSVNDVLPDDKKPGDRWIIDSRTIGGAVFDLGLDFDQVDGAIRCRHAGVEMLDADDAADEYKLLKKAQMQAKSLVVPRDERNKMELVSRNNESMGDVAVSFSPYGSALVFDEHDKDGRHIYYLRELKMDGAVKSKISRKASLLKDVEFSGNDLTVHLVYAQTRSK